MAESDQHEPIGGQHDAGIDQADMYAGIPAGVQASAPVYGGKGGGRRKGGMGGILMILAVGVAVAVAVLLLPKGGPTKAKASEGSDDLGQGIAAGSGIRGHLVTQWNKDHALYKLKIDPIDPRSNAGFAAVTSNPPEPISIVVRVLDGSGFALCGKEVLLPFDPARANATYKAVSLKKAGGSTASPDQIAQEKSREQGKDIFTRVYDENGTVNGLWAEGTLPCSPDQYQKFDYWDLQTNFPTVDAQDKLLGLVKPEVKESTPAERAAAARKKMLLKKPASEFYMEGDDRVVGYEAARSVLFIAPNRTFFISRKTDTATVAQWAEHDALVHFRCDQHAACALSHAGTTGVVLARMNE